MKRVINGLLYNTDTATVICRLPCITQDTRDFAHHITHLYRTAKGRFFIAGIGGPATMWKHKSGNASYDGEGILPVGQMEALQYAEQAELTVEEMTAAGFKVEEA